MIGTAVVSDLHKLEQNETEVIHSVLDIITIQWENVFRCETAMFQSRHVLIYHDGSDDEFLPPVSDYDGVVDSQKHAEEGGAQFGVS